MSCVWHIRFETTDVFEKDEENYLEKTNGDTFHGIPEKTGSRYGDQNKESPFSTPAYNEVSNFLIQRLFTKMWHHRYMLFGIHETAHLSAQDGDSSETIWLWIARHPEAENEKWGEQLYQSARTMNTVGFNSW